jgi:hypothetical protein
VSDITTVYIKQIIKNMSGFHSIFVDEFTWKDRRVDCLIIDLRHRWLRGYEVKTSLADFRHDIKWTEYTEFLSSLSIACPTGLISPNEIQKPFGLLWISNKGVQWKKRPMNFQDRKSLAWFWTYLRVLELETPRLKRENDNLKLGFRQ